MNTPTRQVFCVGTGRCGSTLVSNILRLHPQIASISEFFSFITDLGSRVEESFPPGDVDGRAVWKIIGTPWPRQNVMLRHDVAMDEVIYPWRDGKHRFDRERGVPAIAQVTLPHLTDDPDRLFDELEQAVTSLPPAPIATQYRRVFDWLASRRQSRAWVERSGGGLRIVHRLVQEFPDARFIHIVRGGRTTALSMSQHHGFKMVLACYQMLETLGVDPFVTDDRAWEADLPDDLARLLPERFTREAFLEFEAPPPLCAHYWSGEIIEGLGVLGSLPPERLLTLRFEDLLLDPGPSIRKLVAFVLGNACEESFVSRAASLVGRPKSRWSALPVDVQAQIESACKPGFEALAEIGFTWPSES
jgi:hypothetical protein